MRRVFSPFHTLRSKTVIPLQARRSIDFKRVVRAPAQRDVSSFEPAGRGVEINRLHIFQVWRRCLQKRQVHIMFISKAFHDFQGTAPPRFQPAFAINHQGQFSQRQAVHGGYRKCSYSGLEGHIQHRSSKVKTVRIRPVQQQHQRASLSAAVHQLQHSDIVGIVPQPHILDVHYQDIYLCQFFF